ncbi:cuticle protein 19-like [Euwallacea fornicatus]|uniref:cuticle protein 19-like n=1 Tax=Euwallacea fornicatus TaxID=995702 RepID=UPI00338FCD64
MFAKTLIFLTVVVAYAYAVHLVDYYAYPKYEFKYGVEDPHTGDLKQRAEIRDGDVVKQEYVWGEKDRIVKLAKVDAHDVPVQIAIHH